MGINDCTLDGVKKELYAHIHIYSSVSSDLSNNKYVGKMISHFT